MIATQVTYFESVLATFGLKHPNAVEYHPSELLVNIKQGDHIATKSNMPYWHHGIYVGKDGNEYYVVDMHGRNKAEAVVKKRLFREFLEGVNRCVVIQYDDDSKEKRKFSKDFAIRLAEKLANTEGLYNILNFSCECFATYCRVGRQVVSDYLHINISLQNLKPQPFINIGSFLI